MGFFSIIIIHYRRAGFTLFHAFLQLGCDFLKYLLKHLSKPHFISRFWVKVIFLHPYY